MSDERAGQLIAHCSWPVRFGPVGINRNG